MSLCSSSWLWSVLDDHFALVMVWETFLMVSKLIIPRQAGNASLTQPRGTVPAHMTLPQGAWQGFSGPASCIWEVCGLAQHPEDMAAATWCWVPFPACCMHSQPPLPSQQPCTGTPPNRRLVELLLLLSVTTSCSLCWSKDLGCAALGAGSAAISYLLSG